ncbi:hypothetical protein [Bosea sp. (in: a-proteobacteria)]|jgi:hypothetical protein|uniref:hypothetical protein n=1 Tax=Bosea sp. (in: a-proteobacteria) TaxID=1871050 RepID=UPI003F6E44BB
MNRGTEPLEIWEIISSPAGCAALLYAAERGDPPLEPLVSLIEESWGLWLSDDPDAHPKRIHGMVARLMTADGWQEAGLRPMRRGRLITEAMTYQRSHGATIQ